MRYNTYANYLKEKYGERVYKLPVNLPGTCPNRDGCVGVGGCTFCGEEGAAFENLPNTLSVGEQLRQNMAYIGKKYKAKKYIAYFQNYSNTYMPPEQFRAYIQEAAMNGVVEVAVSTRPDCISREYLEILKEFSERHAIAVSVELGLQTANYHTLERLNRGHTLAEFIDAVMQIKPYGFSVCAHLILNLPWDDRTDLVETAKILSALRVEQVKLHCLYILKGTPLAQQYECGEIDMGSYYDYVETVITFLEYLHPDIVVQRLIGRAREDDALFANYGTSWWKIKDSIDAQMDLLDTRQGARCDYLGGRAVRRFL
ncbi:MAG: TIGR01212 family radical SAM protein [Ruminococcaceae bacterium]|nr:TIGR01212 family radical SAM protein [Oscillospiraceae bacterium]